MHSHQTWKLLVLIDVHQSIGSHELVDDAFMSDPAANNPGTPHTQLNNLNIRLLRLSCGSGKENSQGAIQNVTAASGAQINVCCI